MIDEAALADAIEKGHVAGAGLDVFDVEPPKDWRLASLPQVVATPHIAASTREAQEQVGTETAAALRDFLKEGIIRNAVNFPSVSQEEYKRLRPYLTLARHLGLVVAQMGEARINAVGVRYYGELAQENNQLLGSAVLEGVFCAILSSGGVTPVNARTIAAERGIELIESRSTRPRNYTSLISVKLHYRRRAIAGWKAPSSPTAAFAWSWSTASTSKRRSKARCSSSRTTISRASSATSARCSAATASTSRALPSAGTRSAADCAIGVVNVDEHPGRGSAGTVSDQVLAEIRAIPNIRSVWRVRLDE